MAGNPTQSTDPNGNASSMTYDQDNRLSTTTDADGHVSGMKYDANFGDVIKSWDGLGHITQFAYNPDGEQASEVNPDNAATTTQYTPTGQVWKITDAQPLGNSIGNTTTFGYNNLDLVSTDTDQLGHSINYTYDADGRLTQKTDRNGRTIVYAYDANSRETSEVWTSGAQVDTLTFGYDAAGNLTSAGKGYGSYQFQYDDAERLIQQTDVFGLTLNVGYDSNSNVSSVQDSRGGLLTSVYDGDNHLSTRQFSVGTLQLREDFSYRGDGTLSTETRYKDLAGLQVVGTTTYGSDNNENTLSITHKNAGGVQVEKFAYSYDAANRVTSETDTNAAGAGTTTNYGYDNADQLTSAGGTGYSYDANGNRTMTGYSSGADNRLVSAGGWSYGYDNEGNVVFRQKAGTGEKWSYGYDLNNHLVGATNYSGAGAILAQVTEKYDVFGRRVEEDTTAGGTTTVTKFAYDTAGNVWADLASNGSLARRIYGDGADQPLARITGTGTVAWYLPDHLGSVRAVTNSTTGAVLAEQSFDAYGNLTVQTNAGNLDRYGYAGYQWMVTAGLYKAGARDYNPAVGRWMEVDPIEFGAGDSNLMRYIGNDPTNAIDPSGLQRHRYIPILGDLIEWDRQRFKSNYLDSSLKLSPINTPLGKTFQEYNRKGQLSDKVAFVSDYTADGDADRFRTYRNFNVYDHVKSLGDVAAVLRWYRDNSIDWLVIGGHGMLQERGGQASGSYPGVVFNKYIAASRRDDEVPKKGEAGFSSEQSDIDSNLHPIATLIKQKVKANGIVVLAACNVGKFRANTAPLQTLANRLDRKIVASVDTCGLGLKADGKWELYKPREPLRVRDRFISGFRIAGRNVTFSER